MNAPRGIRTATLSVRRTARLALLGPASGATRELWYVLHGYGQLAAPFLRNFRAIDDGSRLIVAPEALSRFYDGDLSPGAHRDAPIGASWMTREDRETEIADYIAYLDNVHAHVTSLLAGAAPRVTVLGFSQGGATAARWVAAGHANAERLIVWGSAVAPELDLASRDTPLRRAELLLVAGTDDGFISPKVVATELARLRAADFPVHALSFAGGHRLDDATLQSIAGPPLHADATGAA